jgi:hypothetical protein
MTTTLFKDLKELATHFRGLLAPKDAKKFVLLYAYNGTGKTRLAGAFKDLGKKINQDGETTHRDTLYFNAFTEDLFSWHNDLDNDSERYLTLHPTSQFFAGLEELEMDNRIGPILSRYADFEFKLDKAPLSNSLGEPIGEQHIVRFFRTFITPSGKVEVNNIKVSRSEENVFLWCFFLAIVQLVLDGDKNYKWVKYVYIDDPISSLDESNAIAVASHLAHMLNNANNAPKTVVSTHHTLFFNVLCNEVGKKKSHRFFLKINKASDGYLLSDTDNKPFLHHLAQQHDRHQPKTTGQHPLEHRRPTARGDGCGRLPRLHAVLPLPALPLRQLRDGGEEGAGAGLSRCGRRRPQGAAGAVVCEQRGRHPGVREADAPQGALRHPARAPLEQHRQLARTQNAELLNTLQAGFKYIETESFESTFQGLFSEIDLSSPKLGKNL